MLCCKNNQLLVLAVGFKWAALSCSRCLSFFIQSGEEVQCQLELNCGCCSYHMRHCNRNSAASALFHSHTLIFHLNFCRWVLKSFIFMFIRLVTLFLVVRNIDIILSFQHISTALPNHQQCMNKEKNVIFKTTEISHSDFICWILINLLNVFLFSCVCGSCALFSVMLCMEL